MIPIPIALVTLAFVATCMDLDVRTRRIPNVLSASMMLLGPALNALHFGATGLLASLGGLMMVGGLLLAPFALGGIGGGDVKMMGAVGALLGPRHAVLALLVGAVLGGLVMALHLLRRGRLRETAGRIAAMTATALACRSVASLRVSTSAANAVALPYSVPLGLGTVVAIAAAGPGLWG
jgi:prepilin peptidase CpaA